MTTGRDVDEHSSDPRYAAERFWDEHHRIRRRTGAERPNPLLVETAEQLSPGAALDLGCGAGGDAIWLARHGWRVTAVDIAASAVEGLGDRAREYGLADRVISERYDLNSTFPDGEFDLISAQYFHSPFGMDRSQVLRRAARALSNGGMLLIVDHGSTAPWSWNQDPDIRYPTPSEVATGLDLDPTRWPVRRADMPRRRAVGPGGETAIVTDHVLVLRRATG